MERKTVHTQKQGQYLAFIYYYSKLHGCAPSEAEMQRYFRVSPPSVHQMIMRLEARGLLERTPGQARSIRVLIPRIMNGRPFEGKVGLVVAPTKPPVQRSTL